jgi:hypothetical protein
VEFILRLPLPFVGILLAIVCPAPSGREGHPKISVT